MGHPSIAMKIGLLTTNIENLFNGKADIGTASKLGLITTSLQEFLDGKANLSVAMKLGLLTTDLQLLLNRIGKEGAKGMVIGLLLEKI